MFKFGDCGEEGGECVVVEVEERGGELLVRGNVELFESLTELVCLAASQTFGISILVDAFDDVQVFLFKTPKTVLLSQRTVCLTQFADEHILDLTNTRNEFLLLPRRSLRVEVIPFRRAL